MQVGPKAAVDVGWADLSTSSARATESPVVTCGHASGHGENSMLDPPFCTVKAGMLSNSSEALLDEGVAFF